MGKNCAPLVADLFLYYYESDFMDSLNHDNEADVIEAFNSTSKYLLEGRSHIASRYLDDRLKRYK